jgi:sporulation protein YlmC with PRC-barrel domain
MRLSDLLRSDVVDPNGQNVGQIHDVRLVKDGPDQGLFGPAYRIQGLIVGAGAWGSRLGYDRGEMRGPYPLKKLFQWFHGNAKFVDWTYVTGIGDNVVHVSIAKEDLPAVPMLRQ